MQKYLQILLFLLLPLTSLASSDINAMEKADSCFNESNYEEAAVFYQRVLFELRNGEIEQRSELYFKLAYIYKILEKYDDVFAIYDKLLPLQSKIENVDLAARIKIQYAEFLRSIDECYKAFKILESINVESELAHVKLTTLVAYYDRYAAIIVHCEGNLEKALSYSNKALKLAKKSKSNYHIATSLNEIGYIKEHLNSPRAAIPFYREAVKLWDDKKHRRYAPNACFNLSRCYNKIGLVDSSLYFADKGLDIVGDDDWYKMLVPLYSEKISCYEQLGRWKDAYDTRWLYHLAAINMRSQEWSDKMASIRGEFELERKESELTLERSKNEQSQATIEHERRTQKLLVFVIVAVLILVAIIFFFFVKLKRVNTTLQDTISENEILLKEVHHRVKNNMQVVSSLLDLQSSFALDDKSKAALINSRDRINSLALAHQNLYVDGDLKSINIKNYLKVLIKSVVSEDILVKQEIDEGQLEIDKAQALGFVLNELLTNSIKHAWKSNRGDKVIWIKLKRGSDDWSFYYSDNGVGVADKVKFLESPTFGVTLIRSFLKRNLKVSISFGEKPGMNIGFTFK